MNTLDELGSIYSSLLAEERREIIETTIILSDRGSYQIQYYGPFKLYGMMILNEYE